MPFRASWFVTLLPLLLAFGSPSHAQASPEIARTILAVSWSPDGQTYAYVDDRGNLAVVDPRRTATIFQFSGGVSDLLHATAEWSPDGTRLAAGINQQVYVWDTTTWELSAQFRGGWAEYIMFEAVSEYREGIDSITWSTDGRYLITGSLGYLTTVWDIHESKVLFQDFDLAGGGPGRVWLDDGFWMGDGATKLNALTGERGRVKESDRSHTFGGSAVGGETEPHPDNTKIAWGTNHGFLLIIDLNTFWGIQGFDVTDDEPPIPRRALADISWNGTGDAIAAVSRDGEVYIADLVTGEVRTILNVPARIHTIDWNPVTGEILYGGVTESGEPLLAIYSDQTPILWQP